MILANGDRFTLFLSLIEVLVVGTLWDGQALFFLFGEVGAFGTDWLVLAVLTSFVKEVTIITTRNGVAGEGCPVHKLVFLASRDGLALFLGCIEELVFLTFWDRYALVFRLDRILSILANWDWSTLFQVFIEEVVILGIRWHVWWISLGTDLRHTEE